MKFNFKTKPFAHQLTALKKGADAEFFAYLMEMGTGKTKVLIDNTAHLFKKKKIDSLVVVAPKGVYLNWVESEIPAHYPYSYSLYYWSTADTKKNRAEQRYITDLNSVQLKVVVINIEALNTRKGYDFLEEYLKKTKSLMVVDESTTIKNPRAERTRKLTKLAGYAIYRRILTGSPVTNGPLDIYSQFNFLEPGALGHVSYYTFRARYAKLQPVTYGNRAFIKVAGFQHLDELNQSIAPHSYRITKEECLDLPEKTYTTREVSMTKEQNRIYKDMKKECFAEIAEHDAFATAQIALTQMLRLHQIVCGHLTLDDGSILHLPNNRLDALMETLEECTGKVVIWANYRENIKVIATRIKQDYGPESIIEFHGGIDNKVRSEGVRKFQKDKTTRFFVGSQQAGGMGINLFASHTVIYYSNNYKLEDRIQSEDRVHRIGQKHPVTYIDLVTPQSVDKKILKALRNKLNLAQIINGDNYREWIV